MKENDAFEVSYKNGFEAGKRFTAKHGYWKYASQRYPHRFCSECDSKFENSIENIDDWKCCPICLAAMDGKPHVPCAVGDTVYLPWRFDDNEGVAILTVTSIIFDCLHAYIKTDLTSDCDEYLAAYNYGRFSFEEFGETIFLTKEEAEKARIERSENNG